jgi:preprotein translocase subunit SecA
MLFKEIELVTQDNAWSDHLQAMENMKEAVILRQYQNLNPVQEYRNEVFTLFKGLEDTMRFNAVFSLGQSLVDQPAAAQAQAA